MVSTIFEIPHAALIPKTSSFPNKTNIQIPNNNVNIIPLSIRFMPDA